MDSLLFLSSAAMKQVAADIHQHVHEDCLDLSISGDIWSENGIAILAITGYMITRTWTWKEVLLHACPFSKMPHNGDTIQRETMSGLVSSLLILNTSIDFRVCAMRGVYAELSIIVIQVECGVASAPELVSNHVHGCTPDEGSNMLKAWKIFEGAGCVCHMAQTTLKAIVSRVNEAMALVNSIKGIVAHFHRSIKVKALHYCKCYVYCAFVIDV